MSNTWYYRSDLNERWTAIKKSLGDFTGKSLIDIGCHNGWFSINFILDGGGSATGVEKNPEFPGWIKENCEKYKVDVKALNSIEGLGKFDICLYLDLHYDSCVDGYDYLHWIKEHCKVLFTAAAGHGSYNEPYKKLLKEMFGNVTEIITTSYDNRTTYRVDIE